MGKQLQAMYENHNGCGGRGGFTMGGERRGEWFRRNVGTGKRVLDVGCRDGSLTKYFVKGNQVTGVDIDAKMLGKARVRLKIATKHMDIYGQWKFAGKFDVVVMGEVLEHVYYPHNVVAKAREWLVPGGVLLVSVPNAYLISDRLRFVLGREISAHHDPTHINLFSVGKLKGMMRRHFAKVEVSGIAPEVYGGLERVSVSLFAATLLVRAADK